MTPAQHVTIGWAFAVSGAAFLTVLLIERLGKWRTPRTEKWLLWFVASIFWFGLGILNLVRYR